MSESIFGVTPHLPEMTDAQMATLAASGASTVRITVAWSPSDWVALDRRMGIAARAGLKVMMLMGRGSRDAGQAADAGQFADRYRAGGAFWTANPTLRPVPIMVLCGNEPTWSVAPFSGTEQDFAGMVNDHATAIHTVAPSMQVCVGGMQGAQQDYLSRVLRYLTDKPNIFGCAYHPYFATPDLAAAGVAKCRAVMDAHSMPGHPIIIDECGWQVGDVGLNRQAHYLNLFFQTLRYKRAKWKINRVLWYGYADQSGGTGFDLDMGIRDTSDAPKPAWTAFTTHATASGRGR